jgi:hypothetical protein
MARRTSKPLPSLHIPLADLPSLSASDLLAIDGPKFIMSDSEAGCRTCAVLISYDKWKTLNHNTPQVNPHKAEVVFVRKKSYVVISGERDEFKCWRPKKETGMDIINIVRKRSKADG